MEADVVKTDVANGIKVGVLPWGQYTDWPSLREVGRRADELGYDSLWTWDHLYPIQGDWRGPIFEGYMILAGWAGVTSRATLGLMVGANPFRNPALTAKLATTLDHMSDGRAILGIGGAWFGREHTAFGIDFGSSVGERLNRLDEAVELMRAMLPGGPASARGPFYEAKAVLNNPPPVQKHVPILIGGSGERKTLATVARYADGWNTGGDLERVKHKDEVLRRWCDEVGRDESEIERTLGLGLVVIRDDMAAARRAEAAIREHHPGYDEAGRLGTAAQIAESLVPYVELGFRHIFFDSPAPFDGETLERFVGEVKPMLAAAAGAQARR
jgi:alkanesulfonate monooxygenase SsuD/methylene tetrahydromethanopterin reductase-like flavin-dependent oxidoreductase (luciferase family)